MFEHLFNSGVMKIDPGRKVGVFDLEVISKFPALRKAEMEKLRWMEGDWNAENSVRATRVSPAYVDTYPYTYRFCEDGATLCIVRGGKEVPNITYDAFSKKWLLLMPGGGVRDADFRGLVRRLDRVQRSRAHAGLRVRPAYHAHPPQRSRILHVESRAAARRDLDAGR